MSRHLDLQLILEDFNTRRAVSIVAACTLIMLMGALTLRPVQVYTNKARLGGFLMFLTDFKTNVQEYYGYRQTWPDRNALALYMSRYTDPEYFKHVQIENYGWNNGSYWFSLAGVENSKMDGMLTLTPRLSAEAGSVIWLCGYAVRKDTGDTARIKTTINRQYLPAICQ